MGADDYVRQPNSGFLPVFENAGVNGVCDDIGKFAAHCRSWAAYYFRPSKPYLLAEKRDYPTGEFQLQIVANQCTDSILEVTLSFLKTIHASFKSALSFLKTALAFLKTALAFLKAALAFLKAALAFLKAVHTTENSVQLSLYAFKAQGHAEELAGQQGSH